MQYVYIYIPYYLFASPCIHPCPTEGDLRAHAGPLHGRDPDLRPTVRRRAPGVQPPREHRAVGVRGRREVPAVLQLLRRAQDQGLTQLPTALSPSKGGLDTV